MACVPWANLSGPNQLLLAGPVTADATARWMSDMRRWRSGCLADLRLNGSAFETLHWARTAYMQPLAMTFDRLVYDATTHSYTASKYLNSLRKQYGGIDSVLLWPTYTNIGADDRNQFELVEALPGGISDVRAFVNALHAAGVHVLWPYNPCTAAATRIQCTLHPVPL
jgi:iron(II)-dependent oxidoreductase